MVMMPFKQRSEGIKELSHVKIWRERQLSAGLQSRILFCVFKDCREATVTGVEQNKGRKVDSEVTERPGVRPGSTWSTARKTLSLSLWLGDNRKLCDVYFKRIGL